MIGLQVMGCGARQRVASGVGTFVECEAKEIASQLPSLITLGIGALEGAISGDGHTDEAKLKSIMRPATTPLSRCAIAGAVAALLKPVPEQDGAPQSAPLEVDGEGLITAFAEARAELGWQPVKVEGRVL